MSRVLKSLFAVSFLVVGFVSCAKRVVTTAAATEEEEEEESDTSLSIGTAVSMLVEGPTTGLTNNTCHKLTLRVKDIDGNLIRTDQALNLSMDDNSAYAGNFYSDATCTTALTLNATALSAESSSVDVYYYTFYPVSVDVSVISNPALTVTSWTASLAARDLDFIYMDASADEPDGSGNYTAGTCHGPFNLIQFDADGIGLILAMGASTTIVVQNDSGDARFYATSACNTSALATITVPGGTEVSNAFYMKGTTDTAITWTRGDITGGNTFTF